MRDAMLALGFISTLLASAVYFVYNRKTIRGILISLLILVAGVFGVLGMVKIRDLAAGTMPECIQCGEQFDDGDTFCADCGMEITEREGEQQSPSHF